MLVFIVFVIANIIIGRLLEKLKMKFAVVSHSVLFVALILTFAFYNTTNPAALAAQQFMGQQRYFQVYNTVGLGMVQDGELFVSLLTFDFAIILIGVLASVIFVNSVMEMIGAKKHFEENEGVTTSNRISTTKIKSAVVKRIYLKYCSLLC